MEETEALAARVTALSDAQRALLARRLQQAAPVTEVDARATLVAYVVPRGDEPPAPAALREHLQSRLPAHMVPQCFALVEALPRTAAGKLDRGALAVPPAATGVRAHTPAPHAPETLASEAEAVLAAIWCDVLGLPHVGVDEDFFELGGDSLLSIRILSRAGQAGLRISPEAFFANPTIAAQARAAGDAAQTGQERGPVTGPVPLTPIQHWFFERIGVARHHWNQCFVFDLRRETGLGTVEHAVGALLDHHDALRQQFDAAARTARIAAPGLDAPVSHVDLQRCADDRLDEEIEAVATRLNASLDLACAPLLRLALVQTRAGLDDCLVFVAHHLLVDGVSWRILLEDLEQACDDQERAQPPRLPARTSSLKRWSERLTVHARDPALREQLPYWRETCAAEHALPADLAADAERNVAASARTLRLEMDAAVSTAVARALPSRWRTGVRELLLAALAESLAAWRGPGPFRIDMEGHGREALFDDLDVSRTVGWFTSVFPLRLELPPAGHPASTLAVVKRTLQALPAGGIGYGLLRELSDDRAVREALHAPPSQFLFNYLGHVDRRGTRLVLQRDGAGTPRAPQGPRAYAMEVNAFFADGVLRVDWSYSEALHRHDTVTALAGNFERALRAMADACGEDAPAAAAPGDFPLAGLDERDLADLASVLDELDDTPGSTGETR